MGNVRDGASAAAPDRVYFASSAQRIVGAAVVARPRIDWHAWLHRPAQRWRFGGYAIGDAATAEVRTFCL
jgi:hypothetical protein